MLPSLKNLPLKSPSATAGFYVPNGEELPTMNDDPVTMTVPLASVPRTLVDSDSVLATFRVSLPHRNPNGQPHYKYFNPAKLWEWAKRNQELPAREGPIWYEDWWALCNQYNPNHVNVPTWAYSLQTEAAYREEQAARIAEAQAQAQAGPPGSPWPAEAAEATGPRTRASSTGWRERPRSARPSCAVA